MRIRTIKPEFWANEKMAKVDDFTRLLAIGLLNYADDHGYFWANPMLIRGALFPFDEDSTKIRRSLAQLSADGYIRLGKTADGRVGGQVTKFASHQRVDRPQESRIKDLITFDEDSSNIRRTFDDQSLLDQGSGIRDQGTGIREHVLSAPVGAAQSDAEWLATLKAKPVYAGINVENEFQKAQTWCETNRRKCTRRFFTNWLNRAEQSMAPSAGKQLNWTPEAGDY